MTRSVAAALLVDGFDRVRASVADVVAGLDEDALAWRPVPEANSIAWLVWHLARVQDDHLAGIAEVLGHDHAAQVWAADGWVDRFGLPLASEDTGYGHTPDDVAAVRVPADVLAGYHAAVHERTVAIVDRLSDADHERIVDERWDPPVTASVRLVSVLDDVARHVGQAEYVRGLWDRR